MNTKQPSEPYWTQKRVEEQVKAWSEELQPLAKSELDKAVVEMMTTLMAAVAQLQEATFANRRCSAAAADLADQVSAHLRTAMSAVTKRPEKLEG